MNEITIESVNRAVKISKSEAKKNGHDFEYIVLNQHWEIMIEKFGWKIKQRFLYKFQKLRPDFFVWDHDDWIIDDGTTKGFCIDKNISERTMQIMKRIIARNPELQLEDYGDLPVRIAQPQLTMF